jgi:hypothetical protein
LIDGLRHTHSTILSSFVKWELEPFFADSHRPCDLDI